MVWVTPADHGQWVAHHFTEILGPFGTIEEAVARACIAVMKEK
jgi:hypothetical protein